MADEKKLAIIGSGEMALILVENARKKGIQTHTFSNDLHDRAVGISNEHHNISVFETDEIVRICKSIGVCGVLPTTELTISTAAIVSAALGLPGMPVELSKIVTDKAFIRSKAKVVSGLHQPGFTVWTVGDPIPDIERFPVIVKPTAMGGKRGVSVAYNRTEFKKAIEYAVDSMSSSKCNVIIESFIDGGREYSVESLSSQGKHMVIQVTQKITSGPPHCVELGHLQPADVSAEIRSKIEKVIPDLLKAVGIDNTTTHTEIKIVNGEIYLIELNARSGGDHIAYPLTELSTGYPYIHGAIDIAMGTFKFPDSEHFEKNHCGVIFIAQQTKAFEHLFDKCEQYDWLYKKNKKTSELHEIINNQAFDTNYFIFRAGDAVPAEIASILHKLTEVD